MSLTTHERVSNLDNLGFCRVGGSIPVVWTYFGEFQPPNKRGMMLSLLATFWMVGNVVVAVLAWMVIPRDLGINEGPFLYNSWRIFTFLCAVPAFAGKQAQIVDHFAKLWGTVFKRLM